MHIRPIPYIYSHCNFLSGYCEYVGEKDDLSWAHGVSIKPGGTQQTFIQGVSARGSNPSPFYVPCLAEKVPFLYTL